MARSYIHLIGGGPGMLAAFRRHMKAALALSEIEGATRPGSPLVAYVGAASGDDAGFLRMIGDEIARAGGRVRAARLASPRSKLSAAQAVLEDCDVVFVSGGDVEAGMNVLQDRGALPLLRALAAAGRPMIGLSAGSIMLARAWVRFPADGDAAADPTVFPCMGLAPVYVDAHAEEDGWSELRVLLSLVARGGARGDRSPLGFGLTRKGGIRIERHRATDGEHGSGVKVVAFGTAAPRFVARGERIVAGRPLAPGSSTRV